MRFVRLLQFFVAFGAVLATVAAAVRPAPQRPAFSCAYQRGSVRSISLAGEAVVDGLSQRFSETFDIDDGRYKRSWRSAMTPLRGGEGFDGSHWWTQDLSGASHDLNAPDARALAASIAWLNAQMWCSARADGTLRITPPGGAPALVSISKHRIFRVALQLPEEREIETYSNWRNVRGILVPLTRHVDYPEDDEHETWAAVRVFASSARPASAVFARPPTAHDSGIENAATSAEVPLHIIHDKPRISVALNARGPFTYVLDSGGHFIATPATARAVGVQGVGTASETGQGSAILPTRFARITQVRIGRAFMRGQVAKIVPYSPSRLERESLPSATGWLGLETFERFQVSFDPHRGVLSLAPFSRTARPRGVRIPLLFDEDAPLAACTVNGRAGLCMIDTGNGGNTIVEGNWARKNGLEAAMKRGIAVGDDTWVSRARIAIGPLKFPDELVEYSPPAVRGSESTTTVAAILSEDLLRRYVLTLDYSRYAAWFERIPNAKAEAFNRTGLEAVKQSDGTFRITFVIAGSPAASAGIRGGDDITAIDGTPSRNISSAQFFALNRAPPGSLATFAVRRLGRELPHQIRLRLRNLL